MNHLHVAHNGVNNQKGSVALAILGAIVVVGVILEISGGGMSSQSTSIIINARAKAGRDSIAYQIERYTSTPAIFRNSLVSSDNSALQNCVLGNGSSSCLADGTEYPLSLYVGSDGKRFAGPGPVNGNNSHPALFDIKGNLCQGSESSATASCPFEVYTTFTAKCPGAAASCANAESIRVHYVVRTPESLTTSIDFRGRTVFAILDKIVIDVPTKDILPPSHDYVPNKLTTSTMAVKIDINAVVANFDQALNAVEKACPGIDPFLAHDIADYVYNQQHINNIALIGFIAAEWLISPGAARGIASDAAYEFSVGYAVQDIIGYLSPVFSAISWVPDQKWAEALGGAEVDTVSDAQDIMAAAPAGLTDQSTMNALAYARITDSTMAQSVTTAITTAGMDGWQATVFACGAKAAGISDVATLNNYASLFLAGHIGDYDDAIKIMTEGITDLPTILALEAAYEKYLQDQNNGGGGGGGGTPVIVDSPVAPAPTCTDPLACNNTAGI